MNDRCPFGREYIKCPFCGESDFDKIGLKYHFLMGHCDAFNAVMSPEEERLLKKEDKP